ncbi:MAG TPA: class I SAM-dependent methyltransferase [Pseudonocardiaceae bacterium]|nr:class I SAM-dependent methyltransferase [Pseudonocardiaceae bacterium]
MTVRPDELFSSAEPYYARYRSPYPRSLFDFLTDRLHWTTRHQVLDVGCGTGQICVPLAGYVGSVVAIDPLVGMLDLARTAADQAGVANIDWRRADSSRLAELGVTGAAGAVFAASFHWVDRPAVARALDGILAPDGAMVVITDGLTSEEQPDWVDVIAEIRARYLGPKRLAGSGTWAPPPRRHTEVLRDSPFSAVEIVPWSWQRRLTVDEVVGLQFSYSFSTPALLGRHAEAFAEDVRAAVLADHPDGVLVEDNSVDVVLAHRP